ncbi:MAG TPA: permease of phosphate ABC transporter [Eubacteriaceae bacterium]|jgi:tetrahydromethanopterin S-methyltransferase subunit C|nr:permease of phosphate ABC transporter [Eubacteriaceae bacterium]
MKDLFKYAQKYKDQMTVIDIGLLKLSLCSLGVLMGMAVPKSQQKRVAACASTVFALAYAPLIAKYLGILTEDCKNRSQYSDDIY